MFWKERVDEFRKDILKELADLHEGVSILLNMRFFDCATGLKMIHNKRQGRLFGFELRKKKSKIEYQYENLSLGKL